MENSGQKTLAVIFCLLLVVMYKQLVFDPYFSGAQRHAQLAATQGTPETAPPATQVAAPKTPVDTAENHSPVPAALKSNSTIPTDGEIAAAGEFHIVTDNFDLTFSLLGGRMTAAALRHFRATGDPGSPRLNLVEHLDGTPFPLGIARGAIDDSNVRYELTSAPKEGGEISDAEKRFSLLSNQLGVFELTGTLPTGEQIRKTITLSGSDYLLDIEVAVQPGAANGAPLELTWNRFIPLDSDVFKDPFHASGFTVFNGIKAERFEFKKTVENKVIPSIKATWVSMADKYFAVTLLSADGATTVTHGRTGQLFEQRLNGSADALHAKVYIGPKSIDILEHAGYGLEHNIDFGWTALIARPLSTLLHMFFRFFGNYGLAIIALTILVRAALFPVNQTSFRQMKRMQELAPEVRRLRETVKDKQQQQAQMMELYKKNKVNPLGGCLPMFIQLPIFIGLYSSLMLAVELRHAKFAFWIKDLSAPEKLMLGHLGIPVMVLLFVASMYVQQMMSPKEGMEPAQRKMMLVMPAIFGVMFIGFPAGLTLYWLTNNVISIAQQQALYNKRGVSPLLITVGTSLIVFAIAYMLVQISS